VDVRAVLGVRMVSLGGTQCKLNPCVKIAVCIANPYSYPLEWDKDLELEFIDDTPRTNNIDTSIYGAGQTQRFLGRGSKSRNPDGSLQSGGYEPGVLNNAVFVISKGTLPAGEARAYTIGRGVTRPVNDSREVKVPLQPFGSSSPSNLENCVELDQPTPSGGNAEFANAKQLDVRESWTTSQPTVELRLAGPRSGNVLCRIERFEWDNAYHARTKTQVNHQAVRTLKMPIPLKVYTNQISLPGADYQNQLPSRDMMGTRCSTLRTYADFNLRASRFGKLITSYNPPPYFFIQADDIVVDLPPTPASSSLPPNTGPAFTRDLALSPVPWGRSLTSRDVEKTILFTFPKQFVSLAQLQHADLTADDEGVSISQQPGNAFGNSYASPFVKRKAPILARNNYHVSGQNTGVAGSSVKLPANYYDMSYLLNAAMWDTYYFSALDDYEAAGYDRSLSRPITVAFPPADATALQDPVKAASHLLVNGSFNVNCPTKDAWKALLAGTRFLDHPAGGDPSGAMYPRSLEQTSASATPPTGSGPDAFSGYRRLTPQQIDAVAEEMVKQVRLRGPFVSLSHFVNRALIDLNPRIPSSAMLGRSGALQAALDLGGANITPDGVTSAFGSRLSTKDDKVTLLVEGNYPKADVLYPSGGGFPNNQSNGSRGSTYGGEELDGSPVWANMSADLNFGACASIYADRAMLKDRALQPEQGFRSTGIPGWITQADVLQAIGPVLSARSDTFRIRGYGEALSGDGKTVLARAWCETIVQRTPNYIDPANTPTERDATLTDKVLSPMNKQFGRRFEIVSFRWLSQDEI
jgi:hypothetical protein